MRTVLVAGALLAAPLAAQSPASVTYTLSVDSASSGVDVIMRVRASAREFRLAMVAHTEYDDEYWRYVTGLRGESNGTALTISRADSSEWRVSGPGGDATFRYHVAFPSAARGQQEAWKAHLTPTGGLIGGPHSFLYVEGAERVPLTVDVRVPAPWRIVTGLDSVAAHQYRASGIEQLVDSPMLVGAVRRFPFDIAGVPHTINYLGHPGGAQFDTAALVSRVQQIAHETERMFGSMPYRRYEFLFEDGSYGGLEHVNSVTIGSNSTNLAANIDGLLLQIAHEYFHTWNEVHLRPESWIGVRHTAPQPTGELWWSEGVTIHYAELILRRAGLHTDDSTRLARAEAVIASYLSNPGQSLVSPDAVSRAFNKPATVTGDYAPSMFTQGEALAIVLDLMIRDGSGGTRTLDDVMRSLTSRFSIERGFAGSDVEHAVSDACSCNAKPFFDEYVRSAHPLDFARWLATIGVTMTATRTRALNRDGTPAPDGRLYPITGADSAILLKVWSPQTLWGRAGLHTGDRVESLNGQRITDQATFRRVIGTLRIGDTVRLVVWRGTERIEKAIVVEGYDRVTVRLERAPGAAPARRAAFATWAAGR
ncbi:MAG TPA: PDZ domain-containing protein [Gemmatimonadaceae bacterium]|nr:PDZ domain-containing protein [Gemmatimonadaceae bacterium]